jgi:hypothetical protein
MIMYYDWDEDDIPSDEDELIEQMFENPHSASALRRATKSNPRNLPCPTCEKPNRLTPQDVWKGYQCDECANRAERGGW